MPQQQAPTQQQPLQNWNNQTSPQYFQPQQPINYPNNFKTNNNLTNEAPQPTMTTNYFNSEPNSNDGWSDFNDWNDNDPAPQQQTFQQQPEPIQNYQQPIQQFQPIVQPQPTEPSHNYQQPNQPMFVQQPYPNDSWNWNNGEQFPKVSQDSVVKHSKNIELDVGQADPISYNQIVSSETENLQSRIPDDSKNTQNLTNPVLQRVRKTEPQLTPQWSIESQMSQTSSDRSIESDNLDSTATTSEEIMNVRTNQNIESCYENNQYNSSYLEKRNDILTNIGEMDSLDQALMEINEPKPTSPPLMVVPPPQLPPISAGSSSNLYRRTTLPIHRNLQFQPPSVAAPTIIPTNFHHDETPDNSEVPGQEIAPTNERNQYLQTGHLSEEPTIPSPPAPTISENVDFLPPPGLSRLVLGQPENFQNNYNEPPPGLDRMIPGTELENSSDLSFERHADGEVSTARISSFPVPVEPAQINISDRNLYLVPGESTSQSQRVVPGGDEENFTSEIVDLNLQINDEERELIMDGENLEDEPQIPEIQTREEPIEGANTLDEIPTSLVETEIEVHKDLSNTSTANDDSDKERNSYYKNRRGEEIPRKRNTNKSKERYETEDTDYYSDKDRRRYERDVTSRDRGEIRGDRDKERDRYRDRRDTNSHERDRYRRDGDKDRYYKEKYDRDRGERYDRNNSRYETDGSKYDTERDGNRQSSRNEFQKRKDGRDNRDDRDSDFRRDDKDRKYRRDRSDKERDDRRRGEYIFFVVSF